MKRSIERMLTTHSGSLPRLPEVRNLLADKSEGKAVDAATLDAAARASVFDVVARQIDVGLTVVNDGESSKPSYRSYISDRLTGFEVVSNATTGRASSAAGGGLLEEDDFPEYFANRYELDVFARRRSAPAGRLACVGPIEWKDFSAVEKDIQNLRDALEGKQYEDAFLSAVAPVNVTGFCPNQYYASDEEYLQALSDAMKREFEAIVAAGFILQLDYPGLTRGIDQDVEAINYVTKDLPADRVRVHVCWGSDERPHHKDPELKTFVHGAMGLHAAGLTIVAANGRHEHEWRVWEDVEVPEGKVIIPGVIDSTTNIIEHPETVSERIQRYAGVLGKENVIAGVDCGFQTTIGRDQVDPKVAWAKLSSLVEGAELATRALWPQA